MYGLLAKGWAWFTGATSAHETHQAGDGSHTAEEAYVLALEARRIAVATRTALSRLNAKAGEEADETLHAEAGPAQTASPDLVGVGGGSGGSGGRGRGAPTSRSAILSRYYATRWVRAARNGQGHDPRPTGDGKEDSDGNT